MAFTEGKIESGQSDHVRIILPHTSFAKDADAGGISFAFKDNWLMVWKRQARS